MRPTATNRADKEARRDALHCVAHTSVIADRPLYPLIADDGTELSLLLTDSANFRDACLISLDA